MNCWICEDYETCPHAVCYEQEVADRIKQEGDDMTGLEQENQALREEIALLEKENRQLIEENRELRNIEKQPSNKAMYLID